MNSRRLLHSEMSIDTIIKSQRLAKLLLRIIMPIRLRNKIKQILREDINLTKEERQ